MWLKKNGLHWLRNRLNRMGLIQNIYQSLPSCLQNVGISAFGYIWRKRRFGGIFEQQLKGFKERETYNADQWLNYQNAELSKLLKHAEETVPFYRERFRQAGVGSISSVTTETLSRIPFLEKDDLRKFAQSSLLSSQLERGGKFFASSGSTGTPTQILFSHSMHQRWSAGFETRIRHWAGLSRYSSRGMIGGRRVVPEGDSKPPFYRYNIFEKQVYFSAYHISASNAMDYLRGIQNHGVEYMTGYAMSNFFLARFFQEKGLEAPTLKAVITSSEKLTPEMRKTLEQVYHCKSYDSWSGLESCGLVSECEFGSLHISPDIGIVEILDENGRQVKPGEVGEVVCTGLLNFDQPLIRYRIGDVMRLGRGTCSCERNMPIIEEIVGRVEDTVIGLDGREMVRFHGIFIDLPNLIEGQIVQHTLDSFEIKIVTNGNWTGNEEERIRKRMSSQLGQIELKINEVPKILRNQNGKFQAVISKVKRLN